MNGISLVIKIKNIQLGQERTELQWQGFGRRQEETNQCTKGPNLLAWERPSFSTKEEPLMDKKLIGSCTSIGLKLSRMDLHRQVYLYVLLYTKYTLLRINSLNSCFLNYVYINNHVLVHGVEFEMFIMSSHLMSGFRYGPSFSQLYVIITYFTTLTLSYSHSQTRKVF